jgi:hypothetical protein
MKRILLSLTVMAGIANACFAGTWASKGGYTYSANVGEGGMVVLHTVKMTAQEAAQNLMPVAGSPVNVTIEGKYLYVKNTAKNTKEKYDISNPAQPKLIETKKL